MRDRRNFLPVSVGDMTERGWSDVDFVYVTGDAYVDHPSFGTAVIGRVLEAEGYSVAFRWVTTCFWWISAQAEGAKVI